MIEKDRNKMEKNTIYTIYKNERGVSAILIAILLLVLMGFAALALDIGHIVVSRNELLNAADAGALAGARFLYNNNGTAVNPNANQIARNAAIANNAEKIPVEVNLPNDNTGDVKRGHWRFSDKTFWPNTSLLPVNLWNVTTAELDADLDFINAVQVKTRREAIPIVAFFARIFGIPSFQPTATAVAYLGFAGTLAPGEADQPIAICKQSIQDANGLYTCNTGRMLNSGSNDATHNTAGWTNFSQPCDTANANEMRGLICSGGNPGSVTYGQGMGASGGVQDNVFRALRDCWIASDTTPAADGLPNESWELTLPVVDCPGNNVSNCATLLGAVTLKVVFMSPEGGTPDINDAPSEMDGWIFSGSDFNLDGTIDGQDRWGEFVTTFNLQNVDGSPAPYDKKSMYFLPDCTPHEPTGGSGGENYGVLAKIPVLVE